MMTTERAYTADDHLMHDAQCVECGVTFETITSDLCHMCACTGECGHTPDECAEHDARCAAFKARMNDSTPAQV